MTEDKNSHIYWTGATFLEIFDLYITFLKEFSFRNFLINHLIFPPKLELCVMLEIIFKNKINEYYYAG